MWNSVDIVRCPRCGKPHVATPLPLGMQSIGCPEMDEDTYHVYGVREVVVLQTATGPDREGE